MQQFVDFILNIISELGYFGIFVGMAIESSFIPFPSEIIMIPAGYLAHKGEMNIYLAIFFGILGSLVGALVNYYLAKSLARPLLFKIGKYFFVSQSAIEKSEKFFKNHGEISTLTGRLLPGIRQLISLPAGMFEMPLLRFLVLTAIGSGIWVTVLTFFGYFIGQNQDLILQYMPYIKVGGIVLAILLVIGYIVFRRRKKGEIL